jgi:predicted transcriptional regulator
MSKNSFMPPFDLSKREFDVMNVLWTTNRATMASEILKYNLDLNINTVQNALKNLLRKKLVTVAEFKHTNTAIGRSFLPLITLEEYTLNCIDCATSAFAKLSKKTLLLALLHQEKDNALLNEINNIYKKDDK